MAASAATMAAVVSVSGVQLQASSSSSFVNGGANVVMPVSAPRSLKYKLVARASAQESRDESRAQRREVLAGIMAAGALLVGSNAALAVGPGGDGASQTNQQADSLLRAADKLNVDDAPERFGPSQLADSGAKGLGDAGKVAQQAGSGAIDNLQGAASDAVDTAKSNLEEAKRRTEGVLSGPGDVASSIADKAEEAKSNVQGLFGQGKNKVDDAQSSARNLAGDAQSSARNLAGDAQSGAKNIVGQAQDKADDASKTVKNIFGQVQDKASDTQKDAKNIFGQAQNKSQDIVGDAQSKVSSGAETGKQEAGGLFESLQNSLKGLTDTVASKGDDAKNAVDDATSKVQRTF